MEIKLKSTYKGTRILFGDTATKKRNLINQMIDILTKNGYNEMMIPIIQQQSTFQSKVGDENRNMMYNFKDRGDRDICLAPEYTAVIQQMSSEYFRYTKDVKLFYVAECFRGENVQSGRYRQFTQFGVEIINPKKDYTNELIDISTSIVRLVTDKYDLNIEAKRGLDYYKNGQGFEISCPDLGAQKQVCGGGEYQGGIGFAVGVDRLILL